MPDEPAAGLRAANARLRELLAERDAQVAALLATPSPAPPRAAAGSPKPDRKPAPERRQSQAMTGTYLVTITQPRQVTGHDGLSRGQRGP